MKKGYKEKILDEANLILQKCEYFANMQFGVVLGDFRSLYRKGVILEFHIA